MSYYAVWIDHDHAKIIKFNSGKAEKTEMKRHGIQHHTSHVETEKNNSVHKFYKDVAHNLESAKEIFVMGPGVAKTEFKHYLEKHKLEKIAEKIVGVESMNKATDGEIEKKAREFYTHRNVFN